MFKAKIAELSIVILVSSVTLQGFSTTNLPAINEDRKPDHPKLADQDPCVQLLQANGKANGLRKRCEPTGTGGGAAKGDFNGDGIADLAVGVPHEDVNGVGGVGAVNVIYGSATGLTATADQVLYETGFGFPLGSGDHFGSALASGDFNGDGFSDLAVGIPDSGPGAVVVVKGSAAGLDLGTATELALLEGASGRAGAALVWADFNGDGFGDLAVGIPDEYVDFGFTKPLLFCTSTPISEAGEVQVFYGSKTGLTRTGAQHLHQGPIEGDLCNSPSTQAVGDRPGLEDHFGATLAAGDFNNDSFADLVVGVPSEGSEEGAVHLIPGSASRLVTQKAQFLNQATPGVGGGAEEGDQFGRSLAVGDFDGDQKDDLAVGIPFEALLSNTAADAGAVQVFFGNNFGGSDLVDPVGDLFISQANLPNTAVEAGDRFGWALAVGHFDGDGLADLAIGVPGENLGSVTGAGVVEVLYGTFGGPSFTRVQTWRQGASGVPDTAEAGDQFGYALSAWNYGRSSQDDLAIGVPFEDIVSSTGVQAGAGAVNVIYGSAAGLSAASSNTPQFWHQDVSGIQDAAQPGDRFGEALY